jgi:signal transduction histidine kinase/CheY-like chemotaxis protein
MRALEKDMGRISPFDSIKWRLLALCIVLALIPAMLLGIVSYRTFKTEAIRNAENDLKRISLDWQIITEDAIGQHERFLRREQVLIEKRLESVALDLHSAAGLTKGTPPAGGVPNPDFGGALARIKIGRSGYAFIICKYPALTHFSCRYAPRAAPLSHSDERGAVASARAFDSLYGVAQNNPSLIRYASAEEDGNIGKTAACIAFEPWHCIIGVCCYSTDYREENFLWTVQENLKTKIAAQRIGANGYIWIIDTTGRYVVSKDRMRDGERIADRRDSQGRYIVRDIISPASRLQQGQTITYRYEWRDLGEQVIRKKISVISSVPQWGWIIGASAYYGDFMGGLGTIRYQIIGVCAASVIVGSAIAYFVALLLSGPFFSLQRALAHEKEMLTKTIRSIGDGVVAVDGAGSIVLVNEVARSMLALPAHAAAFPPLSGLFLLRGMSNGAQARTAAELFAQSAAPFTLENQRLLLAGGTDAGHTVDCAFAPIVDRAGNADGAVLVLRDMTKRLELEERLHHDDKLRAVGQLAGGIAHDFNNQLTGIIVHAELVKMENTPAPRTVGYAEAIIKAARHSARLTSQLLSFARKQPVTAVRVDVHAVIGDVVEVLERSIDKRIRIVMDLSAPFATVMGDSSMLQNALLNLAINARDALPEGGRITFGTMLVDQTGAEHSAAGLAEGQEHIRVMVSDNGIGMDQATKRRLFEPFFTTKEPGKGTGMGLASVYGAVSGHKGKIRVESEVGKGTSFYCYFPCVKTDAAADAGKGPQRPLSGHVMVVDDEKSVLHAISTVLKWSGCEVTACDSGAAAVERFPALRGRIDLVMMDMVMPGMDGPEAMRRLLSIDPAARFLVMSGHVFDSADTVMTGKEIVGFVRKPFVVESLRSTLQELLKKTGR